MIIALMLGYQRNVSSRICRRNGTSHLLAGGPTLTVLSLDFSCLDGIHRLLNWAFMSSTGIINGARLPESNQRLAGMLRQHVSTSES